MNIIYMVVGREGGGSVVCVCVDCPVDDELSVLC